MEFSVNEHFFPRRPNWSRVEESSVFVCVCVPYALCLNQFEY